MAKPRSQFLTRFVSDFTLGYSDGLTVPFALTAGLSSLGRAQTVIFAGLAEICAGSISMGIGGYLSALEDVRGARDTMKMRKEGDLEEKTAMLTDDDACSGVSSSSETFGDSYGKETMRRRLEPLNLSSELLSDILSVVEQHQQRPYRFVSAADPFVPWPWFSGLSVALGYISGGLIPLLPYCVASTIGVALNWSIGLCVVALFTFGFGKSVFLTTGRVSWSQSVWEGLQMLLLGSMAAIMAVLCIKSIEGSDNIAET